MKHGFCAPVRSGALVALALFLGACENPYLQQFQREFGWTQERMLADGWLQAPPVPPQRVYCYETLADIDCFARPQESQRERRVSDRQVPYLAPDL